MINPKILKTKVMAELKSGFAENNPKGVQIQGFLEPVAYKQFLTEVADANFKQRESRESHSYYESKSKALMFFKSSEFLEFVSNVIGKKMTNAKCSLLMFMHGSYTLLSDEKQNGVEFFFDLTPTWDVKLGGYTMLITAAGEKLMLPPIPNTLVIADSGHSYVKYVNSLAKDNGRMVVRGTI